MSAEQTLADRYRERDAAARAHREAGGVVVGCLGSDVPEELVLAADALPVRMSGDPLRDTAVADRYMETSYDGLSRSQLAAILDGAWSDLDVLVIANQDAGTLRLFYYLREIARVEPRSGIPRFVLFDLLHLPHRTSTHYNVRQAERLRTTLAGFTGHRAEPDDLRRAIATCNDDRRALRRLAGHRTAHPPRLSGTEALRAIGAGLVMDRAAHTELVDELCASLEGRPGVAGVRVFLTGSVQDHTGVYELIERAGAVVVGEDHDWGDRHHATLVDEGADDPLLAVLERLQFGAPGPAKSESIERAEYTAAGAQAAGAEAVISFVRAGDEGPLWDYPAQRDALDRCGIPSALIADQPYRASVLSPAAIGFLESLRAEVVTR